MYPPPVGPLPITGFNMLAFGCIGCGLLVGGLLLLRVAYFSRTRKND